MEPRVRPAAPWLAALCCCVAAAMGASDRLHRPPFRVYWNVPTFGCHRYGLPFNVSAWGLVQNAGDAFRGERVAILYDPGAFPALVRDDAGRLQPRNGGAPQEGDLQRHLDALAADVQRLVPDPDFAGLGVLDMESWRPIWRQLFGSFKPYKEFSRNIERRRHPFWIDAQIEEEARRRFEEGAALFMRASLERVRQLRPRALWGYYAFPYCFNARPGDCPADVQRENDRLQWLFELSSAILPSVYLGAETPAAQQRRDFVRARVAEAQRVARGTPVFAYVRYNHYDTQRFLSSDALYTSLSTPKSMDAAGVVIWGSWNDVKTQAKCQDLQDYVHTILGPMVKNLTYMGNIP